jgi:hypothetical protein
MIFCRRSLRCCYILLCYVTQRTPATRSQNVRRGTSEFGMCYSIDYKLIGIFINLTCIYRSPDLTTGSMVAIVANAQGSDDPVLSIEQSGIRYFASKSLEHRPFSVLNANTRIAGPPRFDRSFPSPFHTGSFGCALSCPSCPFSDIHALHRKWCW